MRYRALDENGDYVIGNGEAYLKDIDAVRQAIITRLHLYLYEWWEQMEDGVPWWQKIVAQRGIDNALKILRERIATTTDVTGILAFEHNWDNENRILSLRVGVQTIYGPFTVEEVL